MRLQNILLICCLCGIIICNSKESVSTDVTYQDTIKQNIEGLLIRNIHHYDDFQSWIYDIDYYFVNKSDSIKLIGSGCNYCQRHPKDEQLNRVGNVNVLFEYKKYKCLPIARTKAPTFGPLSSLSLGTITRKIPAYKNLDF